MKYSNPTPNKYNIGIQKLQSVLKKMIGYFV